MTANEITNPELFQRLETVAKTKQLTTDQYIDYLLKLGFEVDQVHRAAEPQTNPEENRVYANPAEVALARKLHQTEEIEIDEPARISQAPDGYWVQAWVWVSALDELVNSPDEELELDDALAEGG